MRAIPLLLAVASLFLFGCAGKSPEEHLAETNYCEKYAQQETARDAGTGLRYTESRLYRVLYDTCMHKSVGERYYDQ